MEPVVEPWGGGRRGRWGSAPPTTRWAPSSKILKNKFLGAKSELFFMIKYSEIYFNQLRSQGVATIDIQNRRKLINIEEFHYREKSLKGRWYTQPSWIKI